MNNESKGSGMLLPLGIGAGLLLLFYQMKKKPASAAIDNPDFPAEAVQEEEASMKQLAPTPAPAYAQATTTLLPSGPMDNEEDDNAEHGQEQEQEEEDNEDSGHGAGYETRASASGNSQANDQQPQMPARGGGRAPYSTAMAKTTQQQIQARIIEAKARRFTALPEQQRPGARALVPAPGSGSGQVLPGAVAVTAKQVQIMPAVQASKPLLPQPKKIFPLRFGTNSPYVKEVQKRMGVPATGYFGSQTKAAIQKKYRVTDISEALYKQIITGKTTALQPQRKIVARKAVKPVAKKITLRKK